MNKSKSLCAGCRDDFYDGQGAKECWSYKSAQVVTKYAIGWWTMQDKKENFERIETLSCHYEPGQRAFLNDLPSHLK